MCHTREESHDHAKGHPIGKEDPRRLGGTVLAALQGIDEMLFAPAFARAAEGVGSEDAFLNCLLGFCFNPIV